MKRWQSNKLPKAVGPYSCAVESNNMLYISGQVAIDVEKNELRNDLDVESQVELVCNNLKNFFEEKELTFDQVVKTTVLLDDMDNFEKVNAIYEKYFVSKPARSAFAVKTLPKNFKFEVELIMELK